MKPDGTRLIVYAADGMPGVPPALIAFAFEIGERRYLAAYDRSGARDRAHPPAADTACGNHAGTMAELLVDIAQPAGLAAAPRPPRYQAAAIGLRDGSDEAVAVWAAVVNARIGEAIASITAEHVLVESWFRLQLDGRPYLFCVMACAGPPPGAVPQEDAPELEVERVHREFKKHWDRSRHVACRPLD